MTGNLKINAEKIDAVLSETIWSIPLWTLWEKPTAPKFTASRSGFNNMEDALKALAELQGSSEISLPGGGGKLQTSAHLLLEVQSQIDLPDGVQNKAGSVTLNDWQEQIAAGKAPKVVSIIPPCFGFPGADLGGLISDDSSARGFAKNLIKEALTANLALRKAGQGEGITIVWPAFQALRTYACSSEMKITNQWLKDSEQWKRFRNGLIECINEANQETGDQTTIHLEWKTNDPGILDIVPTLELGIDFCQEINEALGYDGAFINNELAHLGLAGTGFIEGVQRTVKAGLQKRLIHMNGGPIHPQRLERILSEEGIHPADWFSGMDPDWPVGFGSPRQIAEQEGATLEVIKHAAEVGEGPIFEQDVFHAPTVIFDGDVLGKQGQVLQPLDVLLWSVVQNRQMVLKAAETLKGN